MKVIFLDIDGVLNCDKTPNPRKFPYIVDKKLLARFTKFLDRTGAKVVLTSSWRVDPVGRFAARHFGVPFMDVCPDMPKRSRREEILAWLADHPKVSRYAVIDNGDDELDELPLFQPSRAIAVRVSKFLATTSQFTIGRAPGPVIVSAT